MPSRPITPFGDTATISTGRWVQDRDYRNWRPQGTRDHLLIYTFSGAGSLHFPSNTSLAGGGDCSLYLPNTPQDYRTAGQSGTWGLIWAHVHPPATWRSYLNWPELSPGLRQVHLNDLVVRRRVKRCLEAMVHHSLSAQPMARELAMNALESALLHIANARPDTAQARLDPRLRPVLDLIHHRFDQPLAIDELAAVAHLSPSRFAHLFREQLSVTPLQYVEAQRLQRARQLLQHTGLSISQIASEVGFAEPFYFSRRFKLATGVSPRAYRETL
ncbi:MAG: helix-turn-helix domain-containing protein [Algisphaera sp.]